MHLLEVAERRGYRKGLCPENGEGSGGQYQCTLSDIERSHHDGNRLYRSVISIDNIGSKEYMRSSDL